MKIKSIILIKLFIFLSIMIFQPVKSQELRGGLSFGFNLSPKINADIEFQARKLHFPEPGFNRISQTKLVYEINKFWQVSGTYTYSSLLIRSDELGEIENENSEKHKIAGDLIFKIKRFDNDIKLSNRLRYQYATTDDKKPKEYLRNKLVMDYKISNELEPYFAIEPYYNLHSKSLRFLRFYIGNEISVKSSKIELYYITELDLKEKYITAQYILGAAYKFSYKKNKHK